MSASAKSSVSSARATIRSGNKIYRAPPTPPASELTEKEKRFVLDCRATSSISNEYARSNPKMGDVIPPYNAQKDSLTRRYWTFDGVDRTLSRTKQHGGGTSIVGPVMDYYHEKGPGSQYLSLRNQSGAGHSVELTDGHTKYMSNTKPLLGYHGPFGYRRNTPWMRKYPSPFGVDTYSPIH